MNTRLEAHKCGLGILAVGTLVTRESGPNSGRPKISLTSLKRSEQGVDSPRNAKTGLQTTTKRRDIFLAGDRDAHSVRPTHVKAFRHAKRQTNIQKSHRHPKREVGNPVKTRFSRVRSKHGSAPSADSARGIGEGCPR